MLAEFFTPLFCEAGASAGSSAAAAVGCAAAGCSSALSIVTSETSNAATGCSPALSIVAAEISIFAAGCSVADAKSTEPPSAALSTGAATFSAAAGLRSRLNPGISNALSLVISGIFKVLPIIIKFGFLIPFASCSCFTVTPNCFAILDKVSPL